MFLNNSSLNLKCILSISFILLMQLLYSQNPVIDSLKTELQNHKQKDTTRVKLLNYLAYHNYRNNPPEATTYVEEALKLAYEIKSEKISLS